MKKYLDTLNENQLKSVENIYGPTRIIAGPGTGKTRTLISKIIYLIENNYAETNEILVITFTNKASKELKKRLLDILDVEELNIDVFTYHGWAARLLRIEYKNIGRDANYSILDTYDSEKLIGKVISENPDLLLKNFNSKELSLEFQKLNFGEKIIITNENIIKREKTIINLYEKYISKKRENNFLDFDDLLIETKELLIKHKEIAKKYENKYKFIFIDEFQDTNKIQFEIIKAITSKNHNITIVGDPDQNIYSWRGADIDLILNFEKEYENVKTFFLNHNYRSSQNILNIANNLINNNFKREVVNLHSDLHNGKISILEGFDQYHEAKLVIEKIKELREEIPLKNIAIILRSNYLSRDFEVMLPKNKINYKIIGGFKFFERKEVKEVLHFLKFLVVQNNFSFIEIANVPTRGVGEITINKIEREATKQNLSIWNYLQSISGLKNARLENFVNICEKYIEEIKNNCNISDLLEKYLKEIEYFEFYNDEENRINNIQAILEQIRSEFGNVEIEYITLQEKVNNFLNSISLSSSSDVEEENEYITLITCHSAKGTEYEAVFIVGMNEETFPSKKSILNKELEEERRVFYVAITRAKRLLFLSLNSGMNYSNKNRMPSRFIDELSIGAEIILKNNAIGKNTDFSQGDSVEHTMFGKGVIINVSEKTISIAFEKRSGIKEFLKGHPSLKKV